MTKQDPMHNERADDEATFLETENMHPNSEGEAEPGLTPVPLGDEVWDAFELDDDSAEPEPEYGDFWGEVDDEEVV
jgi:hypothetical protein